MRMRIALTAAAALGCASCQSSSRASQPAGVVERPRMALDSWGSMVDGSSRSLQERVKQGGNTGALSVRTLRVTDLRAEVNFSEMYQSDPCYVFRYNPWNPSDPCAESCLGGMLQVGAFKSPPVFVGVCSTTGKPVFEITAVW